MNLTILRNEEYATALKEALTMRRNGTIDRATDDQLPIYETILSDLTAMEERIYGNRT